MESNVIQECFIYNAKRILVEEIALEGLEGIGLDLLWRRVEYRTNFAIPGKMKCRFWEFILNNKEIALYHLPEPLPHVEVVDRFTIIDEESGDLKNPDTYLDGPYEYHPSTGEFGSSKYYLTRIAIPSSEFKDTSYEKVLALYGNTLVMVASREERWNALAGHMPITYLYQLTQIQYCILELIGKGRLNGQMTTGTTNLNKIIKEPKNLFYNRKLLRDLGLIRVLYITQNLGNRGIKSLLLRLTKYHKPTILSMPKVGKIFNLVEYLKNRPGYCERTDAMWKNQLMTCTQSKRLKKTMNVFKFEERTVKLDELPRIKSKSSTPSLYRKRKIIRLAPPSDDEFSQSDDDANETPVIKCQYKVGVGLLRQAYERFLEGGLKGLDQLELAQMLGVEFYTGRTICRIFKAKKIVREYFEDRGKQRVIRYVAIASGKTDTNYIKEAQTFLEHTKKTVAPIHQNDGDVEMIDITNEETDNHILEIKGTDDGTPDLGSLLSLKTLTLRQLKFANGILKIVKERQCVTGFQTLSNLVSKEINEPPMVTKALKLFIQRIALGGHLKIYKVRWPGVGNEHNFSNLICAPHIKSTHPIVRAKYKEVFLRAAAKKRPAIVATPSENSCRPLSMFVNPRYMKIQCLHEFIMEMVYFKHEASDLKPGFMSVSELMPKMTVKFAISNMSVNGMSDISDLHIQETHLNLKLKDAPPEISHFIIKSKSLRNAIRMNLKVLAMHGLIQLIYQPHVQTADYANSQLSSFLFYVNRNARIVNTTGQWPRPNANLKSLERAYYFETFDDVKNYWNDVYEISIATKITTVDRMKKKIFPPVRREEDIQLYDNGDRYGDGGGPCGFDSCFYMEIQRLWQTFYVRTLKPRVQPKKKEKTVKMPKLAKSRKPRAPRKKKSVPKVNPVMKLKARPRSRKRLADETVLWSKEEDYVITMCHAAITIASPSSQPGSLKVRNMVAKDILSRNDPKKTQSTCHRRALVIQLNPTMVHEKDSLLNEMRRRRDLIQKYEGLIKKLRVRYSTNMSKFINESRIPMLELIWLIWQVSKSESYMRRLPCVAIDAKDFHENYSIVPATANKLYNLYKSPDLAPLREGVFVTIMMTYNNEIKSDMAKKIYSIFKVYPENSLRIVVDQLRKCCAVSAKEKIFNNQMHRLHLEDVVQSAYKISANYQRRWIGRLNSEFVVSLGKIIEEGLPECEFKGSAEMNCLMSELQASGLLDVVTATLPEIVDGPETVSQDDQINVLDIEMKSKLKSGTVKWQSKPDKHNTKDIAKLYQNIEYEQVIQALAKNSVLHIKENLNETYNQKDSIVMHLLRKGEEGLSFKELQKITSNDTQSLVTRLSQLESLDVVKRVGFYNNTLIHSKFISHYALKIENKYAILTPWMTVDSEVRYDVFLEWTGVIMNKIFEYPGISIPNLADYFELITIRAVQDICMFLDKTKCITLYTLKALEQDLFSDEDIPPELSDFNPYGAPDEMIAFPIKDSLTRYTYLKKTMLERNVAVKNL